MTEIFVLDVTVAMSAKREVRQKAIERRCLECSSGKATRRGLCRHCYNAFYYHASRMSERERVQYEADCIKQGKLLKRYEKSYRPSSSTFHRLAKKRGA